VTLPSGGDIPPEPEGRAGPSRGCRRRGLAPARDGPATARRTPRRAGHWRPTRPRWTPRRPAAPSTGYGCSPLPGRPGRRSRPRRKG